MKYQVGQKVIIVNYRTSGMNNEGQMDKWLGKVMTIRAIQYDHYKMVEDTDENSYLGGWNWYENMIEREAISEEELGELNKLIEAIEAAGSAWEKHCLYDQAVKISLAETNKHFVECFECGEIISVDDGYKYDKDYYCQDCYEEHFSVCENCGELVPIDSMHETVDGYVCTPCRNSYYARCERCGDLVRHHDLYTVYTNPSDNEEYEDWCESCIDYHAGWCEDHEIYHTDGCPFCSGESLHEYGYKPDPYFYGESEDGLFMGVELEVDDGRYPSELAEAIDSIAGDYVYCKHDGSLDDGVEIVSHPATLEFHREHFPWKAIMQECISHGFRSHDTSTCGLHVHVSRDFFGATEEEQDCNIGKLMLIFNRFWDAYIIPFTRRRSSNLDRWAKKNCSLNGCTTKETIKSFTDKVKASDGDRYQAINIQNYNTVEFRIFRGTLKWETFIATLEWVAKICQAAKDIKLKDIPSMSWEMTYPNPSEELTEYMNKRSEYFAVDNIINPITPIEGLSKYEVGDKVTILSWETLKRRYQVSSTRDAIYTPYCVFTNGMKQYCGKQLKIARIVTDDIFELEGVEGEFWFSTAMFRKPSKLKKVKPETITLDI